MSASGLMLKLFLIICSVSTRTCFLWIWTETFSLIRLEKFEAVVIIIDSPSFATSTTPCSIKNVVFFHQCLCSECILFFAIEKLRARKGRRKQWTCCWSTERLRCFNAVLKRQDDLPYLFMVKESFKNSMMRFQGYPQDIRTWFRLVSLIYNTSIKIHKVPGPQPFWCQKREQVGKSKQIHFPEKVKAD